jgi:hypothetical protein
MSPEAGLARKFRRALGLSRAMPVRTSASYSGQAGGSLDAGTNSRHAAGLADVTRSTLDLSHN